MGELVAQPEKQEWVKLNLLDPYTKKEIEWKVGGLSRFEIELAKDIEHITSNNPAETIVYTDPKFTLTCKRSADGKQTCDLKLVQMKVHMMRLNDCFSINIDELTFNKKVADKQVHEVQQILNNWLQTNQTLQDAVGALLKVGANILHTYLSAQK